MSSLRILLAAFLAVFSLCCPALADLTALARVDADASAITDAGEGVTLTLALSQPVPWRVFTLDDPRRLVLDLSEVTWPEDIPRGSARVGTVKTGMTKAGWSRMVVDLSQPLAIATAALDTGQGGATLRVTLKPVSEDEFRAKSGMPETARALPENARGATEVRRKGGSIRVMLDPGHGGVDPGAEAGGLAEADLMLTFARELREVLIRSGRFEVGLTRDGDSFVPLESRITMARSFAADALVSLHADALPEDAGHASGATVYTLADAASDRASLLLAERHDQSDLLSGVDLDGQGDGIVLVLMDLARRDTAPRSERLATQLVDSLRAQTGMVSGRPLRHAAFSVLKAPDLPSVLVELGFLSSKSDRARLQDPEARAKIAVAIRDALLSWSEAEARRPRRANAQ